MITERNANATDSRPVLSLCPENILDLGTIAASDLSMILGPLADKLFFHKMVPSGTELRRMLSLHFARANKIGNGDFTLMILETYGIYRSLAIRLRLKFTSNGSTSPQIKDHLLLLIHPFRALQDYKGMLDSLDYFFKDENQIPLVDPNEFRNELIKYLWDKLEIKPAKSVASKRGKRRLFSYTNSLG